MTVSKEIKKIMFAFDLIEHEHKPDLFMKPMTLNLDDGAGGEERVDITLYADFRKTETGQFYSDPGVAHDDVPVIEELKAAIAKLPDYRDDSAETPAPATPRPNTAVETSPGHTKTSAIQKARDGKPTGLDMVIPTLGVTMRELGLISDIDYYLSTDGFQITLAKEGVTKLAAFASRLDKPIMISDEYEEIEFNRDDNGQLQRIRLKGRAWIGAKVSPVRMITDEIDWDWNSAVTRAIIKNVKNGEYLRYSSEHKTHGLPYKDKKALENALTPDDVTYNMDGTLTPKPDIPTNKLLPLMSYMADVREFALRTCIGKMRSRMWSELLGLRSMSAKEVKIVDASGAKED